MSNLIEIDGSFGEGGGQILRTSLALSLLTGKGFHLRNVRARRPKPGLQPQHLQSVQAAATIGKAQLNGASLGSCDLVFEPGEITAGNYTFDIGTAGATALVLHTIYLPLALRGQDPSELTLVGGTHVSTSPSYHFLDSTWRRYLEHFGLHVGLRILRPGFYPRGGGCIKAFIQPCQGLRGVTLPERGKVKVSGVSAVAGLDKKIAQRQARRALHRLERQGLTADIKEESWEGGLGSVVHLELDTVPVPTAFFALGARGKSSEDVADEAVDHLLSYLKVGKALVDSHSADQILLPLALAKGPSEYETTEVTLHLTTNVSVIKHFLDREIVCEGEEGQSGRVRIG